MCTSRWLGGAVLSFQMVGITRHDFFSSFESITVPCPTTIHALKNYEAPGAVGDWTTFLCWLKGTKQLFLEHTMAISRTAGLHIVSFCFRDKGDRGDLENAQKAFLSVAHLCTHVNNLKSINFENSESVNFLSDEGVFIHFKTLIIFKWDDTQIISSAANTLNVDPQENWGKKVAQCKHCRTIVSRCSCKLSHWSYKKHPQIVF